MLDRCRRLSQRCVIVITSRLVCALSVNFVQQMYADKHQACSSGTAPRDIDFQRRLKILLAFTHRSIFLASHVHMLGGSTVFPTSSWPPATAREQQYVGGRLGNHSIAPLCRMYLNTLSPQERCTGPSAIDSRRSSSSFMRFYISPAVSLHAIHTRTPPPKSIHRHVLQPFALSRRVIAFASRRIIHARGNHDRINMIVLALDDTFNIPQQKCCVEQPCLTQRARYHTRQGCYQYRNRYLC